MSNETQNPTTTPEPTLPVLFCAAEVNLLESALWRYQELSHGPAAKARIDHLTRRIEDAASENAPRGTRPRRCYLQITAKEFGSLESAIWHWQDVTKPGITARTRSEHLLNEIAECIAALEDSVE